MTTEQLAEQVWARIRETGAPALGWWVFAALALALLVVGIGPLWRLVRPAVTIVHELGHAAVGIAVGRRFTGFVVNGDMSGHAVTVGPARGPGRVASAWAGYPAPAFLGAVLVQIAGAGWSRQAALVCLLVLILSLVFARSAHTVLVVLITALVAGALFWWASATVLAGAVLALAVLLLLGAWRHLGAVMSRGRGIDDPQQLARLTGVPAWVWNAGYVLVHAACTWWAWTALTPLLR